MFRNKGTSYSKHRIKTCQSVIQPATVPIIWLQRELQREQQKIKELEVRDEQQKKVLKVKTEEMTALQRKLRVGTSMSHRYYISVDIIGASRPLTGSPMDLPTFFFLVFFFFFSPSAAENGIPGGQTHGRKPWIDLIF